MGPAESRNLASPVHVKPSGLAWKLNRLRCMTAAEIGHRVVKAASMRAERMGFVRTTVPAADLTIRAKPWAECDASVDPAPYVDSADRIAAGRLDVFALRDVELGSPPRWNRDPKTGIEAPLAFGKTLDYRDAAQVGDCKYLWEPNRHLQLVTLAQAYCLTKDPRYGDALREQLDSWFTVCGCLMGPNWSSALEAALRLINWSIAWQLIGGVGSRVFHGAEGEAFRARWLTSVYQHAEFVSGHYSLHSSANNHLIGELAGVVIAAIAWPHWEKSKAWFRAAHAMLEREVLLQNAPDGVNREQAVSYQQWELDLLLLPLLAGQANGYAFSGGYRARVEAMLAYLASIIDVNGNVPMFGDADDGYVVRLDPRPEFSSYHSLLATGAILFERAEFKAKARTLDDKTRWLFGPGADAAFAAVDASSAVLPVRRDFPDGGYYILGNDFETPEEIRLIADAGPLGYREIAAHGHADALSFTLSVGGEEFFVDPGTFAYHTEAEWRAYFRGTSAHNTVRIDGIDQSEPGGNFMWLRKARATCSRWMTSADEDFFEGWHDG
jgi:heparinase II/III-like protein